MRYKKLDPKFKKRWVNALRSGKYTQGTDSLAVGTDDKIEYHCCLGVACDLIDPDSWKPDRSLFVDVLYGWKGHGSGTTKNLPFVTPTVGRKLAEMNDSGLTFSEIADWIEANL